METAIEIDERNEIYCDFVNDILNVKYGLEYQHAYSVGKNKLYCAMNIVAGVLGSGSVVAFVTDNIPSENIKVIMGIIGLILALIASLHFFLPFKEQIKKIDIVSAKTIEELSWALIEFKKLKNIKLESLEKKVDILSVKFVGKIKVANQHWHDIKINKNIQDYKDRAENETMNYQKFNFLNYKNKE
ncbi:MAG: hypothetical protein HRT88_03475 [Lentisphaeraceae bacterium]|nr:hypothetical protein [Lentisphaeraceae bacterium]